MQTTKLDFKKMVVSDDETWLSKLAQVTPLISSVTQLEFQKVPAASLEMLLEKIAKDSFCQISGKKIQNFVFSTRESARINYQ